MLLENVQIDFAKMNSVVDSLVGVIRGKVFIDDEHEFKIRLISKELLTNVLSYSNADNILLSAVLENGMLTIIIEDNGGGFCHKKLMDRNVSEGEFVMRESGRGMYLVRMMSDKLWYNEKGNTVRVSLGLE